MINVSERLELFKNMIAPVSGLYVTEFSEKFELISTTAPNKNILNIVFLLGAGDEPKLLRESDMFHDPNRFSGVISLITNKLGMAWISEVETAENEVKGIHILGPVFLNNYQTEEIRMELNRLQISLDVKKIFMDEIQKIPIVTLSKFYEYGIMFHYCITGEKIQVADFTFKTEEGDKHYYEPSKNQMVNYQIEQRILSLVEQGNLQWKEEFQKIGLPDEWKDFAGTDLLRQAKNTVIIFSTLCCRAAIKGGLSVDVAMTLSDIVIQRVEDAKDLGTVNQINQAMVDDYVKRVHQIKLNTGISPQIQRSCDYISTHLGEKIDIGRIAKDLGYTDYYFSKKFKKEVGIGVREYAAGKKIERAKQLLEDVSMGINEIAEELGYVNQSYFGDVFKKATGVSPTEYRNRKSNTESS